jgi:hypothetical protein
MAVRRFEEFWGLGFLRLQTRCSNGEKLVENFLDGQRTFATFGGDPVATRTEKQKATREGSFFYACYFSALSWLRG